jgi:signal transduction histidine kinase
MLFLAFALADRIHQETQLKQQSQEEALKLKQSLLKTLAISERNLEKQVKERTVALETSLANEKQIRIQYIRFGALISHEFRNQLAIIRSQLSVIDKEYQQGIVALEKRIPIINLTINRLTSLFDKWLQDGRLNDDNHVLVIDRIDVTAWLSDLIEQYKTLQPEYAFIIKFNSEVTELFADVELLTMAVKNLIDNACKYSPADSLITIEVRQQDRMVGIAVIDHGLGIAEKHQHQIFSDYYRVNPESVIQGLGLGLSLVKRIINRHGGHIELTSVLGNGSCFCLWLKHNRDAYANSTI